MQKILLFILLLCGLIVAILLLSNTASQHKDLVPEPKIDKPLDQTPTPTSLATTSLFVPYWSLSETSILTGYTQLIYFGIMANQAGIDTQEDGYKNLAKFTQHIPADTKKLLALRMIDSQVNQQVLQDPTLQEKIISQTIATAESNGFDGIVLDLEYSGFAFPTVTDGVTNFSTNFAQHVKAHHLSFYQTLYGDTFYAARPFAVGKIGQASDGLFILSYDFHKANGTPGPNFPLSTNNDADYNFSQMLEDFSAKVPKSKLTIVFGMFGYDWTIDDKGRSEKTAESLSDTDIQEKFLSDCQLKNCAIHRSNTTQESSVSYTDSQGNNHIVWFEDTKSVEKKKAVLQQEGFSSIGFWANGYF